ncbi:MAG: GspE/PulE family protein [Candidatus Moraniibacteriota bacterium]|jgi:type II secretory ATPase GspE/PulE/Tfp pilus assembly ATPase PilB-like protein
MKIENDQLYDYLIENKIVKEAEIAPVFVRAQRENVQLCELLMEKEIINEMDCIKSFASILGFPFVDLTKEEVDAKVLNIIPEQVAKKSQVVAFEKAGETLKVAMLDPEDLQMIDFLKKKTGLDIMPYVTTDDSIKTILKQYTKSLEAEFGDMIKDSDADDIENSEKNEDLVKISEDLPIVRIVDTLIKHAILDGASDIHIEPQEKKIIVRYRIDGILRQAMTLPKDAMSGVTARIKVLSKLKLDEHRLPQDGRFKMETDEYKLSFRVSILPVFDGEKIVMRLLDESSHGLTLEKMGLQGESLEAIQREIRKPNGMVLVTGPTGSGKTTTLYTIVDILNSPEVNISTVEDPVEYRMDSINQTQVQSKIGMTFAAGLRSLLRQDPDIIMVGEIRDKETLEIAIHAAMTGHLVLSTLHTNSAAGAIPRMVDMGAEPFLIASTTNIVVAQRLVRKLCVECRESYKLDEKEVETLSLNYDIEAITKTLQRVKVLKPGVSWTDIELFKPNGCSQCNGSGYKGRAGIYEVFEITEAIEKLITQNATSDAMERKAREDGMVTMVEDGFNKIIQGVTSIEEVMRVTKE